MLFGKAKKMIEDKESEMRLNLSNNYKDAAYKSFLEWKDVVESLKNNGKLGDRDYEKIQSRIEEFEIKFKNMKR